METVRADVAIVGAGGAGLRAAIALAESSPELRIALISKVYPMRSHTCAAEGGAAGVIKPDDSLEHHFNDTVGGGDWLCDQDAVDYLVQEAPRELIQLEHWGCPWSRQADGTVAVRPFGGMKKQGTGLAAIEMRSGQMRRFDARAVIVAGGGAGRIFPFTTNGAIKTGDGMALAYRAGVPLKEMGVLPDHPTRPPHAASL